MLPSTFVHGTARRAGCQIVYSRRMINSDGESKFKALVEEAKRKKALASEARRDNLSNTKNFMKDLISNTRDVSRSSPRAPHDRIRDNLTDRNNGPSGRFDNNNRSGNNRSDNNRFDNRPNQGRFDRPQLNRSFDKGQRGSGSYNGGGNIRGQFNNNRERRQPWRRNEPQQIVLPKWEYGTDLEKEYMTDLIQKVYEANQEGEVAMIQEDGTLDECTFYKYYDIVPEGKVMGIVDIQERQNGDKFVLMKFFDRRTKLQEFSDKLAKEITAKYGRTRESRRKDANLKNVKVSWEISQQDLDNQKTNEILNHINKGNKLYLVIGEKKGLKKHIFHQHEDAATEEEDTKLNDGYDDVFGPEPSKTHEPPLHPLEQKRREQVLEQVKAIFEDKANIVVRGSVNGRVTINSEPLPKTSQEKKELKAEGIEKKSEDGEPKEPEMSAKDKKKAERKEKERLRLERKKAKEEAKKNRPSILDTLN